MSDIKVSIIIPVYNVSAYLRRCLDSCVNQTMRETEIIVVNDCSPDPLDTEIMREYELKYPGKVRCIWHSENKKLGGTRNTGIYAAKAEYMSFVDSDDYIELDMCEKLYAVAKESDADYVYCDYYEVGEKRKYVYRYNELDPYNERNLHPQCMSCGCIVKRKLFVANNLRFIEGLKYNEDVPMTLLLLILSQKRVKLTEALYYYCINPNSTTQSSTIYDRIPSAYKAFAQTRQLLKAIKKEQKLFLFDLKTVVWLLDYLFVVYGCVRNNNDLFTECVHQNKINLFTEYVHQNKINMVTIVDSISNRYKREKIRFLWNSIQGAISRKELKTALVDFDASFIKETLGELGLADGKIVVWGSGQRGLRMSLCLREANILFAVTDGNTNRYGTEIIEGVVVEPWIKLKGTTDVVIATPKLQYDAIRAQISNDIAVLDMEELLG